MKDWVKDIEETAVMVVPVLGAGADAATSGAAPVAAREEANTISVKLD